MADHCPHWSRTTGYAQASLYAACPWCELERLRNELTAARLDLEALRRCLRGIASCATCEVCRGAAQSHLHPSAEPAK